MNRTNMHPLVAEYLAALNRASQVLPPTRRAELVEEIEAHLAEKGANRDGVTDADIKNILARLGAPEDIVDAEDRAQPGGDSPPVIPLRTVDFIGLGLVLIGGATLPPIGYLIGAAILGKSNRWT